MFVSLKANRQSKASCRAASLLVLPKRKKRAVSRTKTTIVRPRPSSRQKLFNTVFRFNITGTDMQSETAIHVHGYQHAAAAASSSGYR